MKIKARIALTLGALCVTPAGMAATQALQCGKLFDSASGRMNGASTIVVENNKISQVLPGAVSVPGATVVDLRSQTCSPGFIDLHVHLGQQSSPQSYSEGFRLNP